MPDCFDQYASSGSSNDEPPLSPHLYLHHSTTFYMLTLYEDTALYDHLGELK